MNKQFKYLSWLMLLLCIVSCTGNKLSPKEYSHFINDPDHGLSKEKKINGMIMKVKYLPSDLLAYKEFRNSACSKPEQFDSLQALYASGLTFMLEIISEDGKDVMLRDIHSEQEYKERVNTMNFNLKEVIELRMGEQSIAPSIANLENVYDLRSGRKIMIVFPVKEISSDMQFTFNDEIYYTGINHFTFLSKDLQALPGIKI